MLRTVRVTAVRDEIDLGIGFCGMKSKHVVICRPVSPIRRRITTQTAMIRVMMTVYLTEADLARDVRAALDKVRQGMEIVIEQDRRPVAVLKAPEVTGRKLSEIIAALEASGANALVDEDFARDVEEGVKAYREPWDPASAD